MGLKTIPEKVGPFYYGCPLEFLTRLTIDQPGGETV